MPRFFSALILCLAIVLCNTSTTLAAGPATDQDLVGAWRLVSIETIRPNGEVIYPFYGKHPEGLLIYDRSGWMNVQIVSDPKPPSRAAVPAKVSSLHPLKRRWQR